MPSDSGAGGPPDRRHETPGTSRPPFHAEASFHAEEGPPDPAGEVFGVVRALLYGALAVAFMAWMLWLWQAG